MARDDKGRYIKKGAAAFRTYKDSLDEMAKSGDVLDNLFQKLSQRGAMMKEATEGTKNNFEDQLDIGKELLKNTKNIFNVDLKGKDLSKKIAIRLHPMIHFNQIDVDIKKYNNIEISNVSLEEDFKRTSVFIYRGSASSIEASAYGLIPVYYGPYNFANVNPLFQVLTRRSYITDPKKFENLVNSYSSKERKKIKLFSLDFFEKLKLNKNIFRSL